MFRPLLPQLRFATLSCSLTAMFIISSCSTSKLERRNPVGRVQNPATVNINTADINSLEKLPNVGPALAKKIIDHRDRYGPFRRIEHILVIDGIGESRFREIEHLIAIE